MKRLSVLFPAILAAIVFLSTAVPGHSQWWDRFRSRFFQRQPSVTVESVTPLSLSVEAGKSVTVTVIGSNLQAITSVEVSRGSRPAESVGVVLLQPSRDCSLPRCRRMEISVRTEDLGPYRIAFKAGRSVVKTIGMEVTAPVVAAQRPARPAPPPMSPALPRTMDQPAAMTTRKGGVAIDTVPLPEKVPVISRAGPSKAGTAPEAATIQSRIQATPEKLSERERATQAMRDDSTQGAPLYSSDPRVRRALGFCPEGEFKSSEWKDCSCPKGYAKVVPGRAYLWEKCVPMGPCPEGPFEEGSPVEGWVPCACPDGHAKTRVVENGRTVECISPDDLYDVTVTLDRIAVHDDCDNITEGDWLMLFRAETSNPGAVMIPDIAWWPKKNESKNVDGGKTYRNPKKSITIHNIRASDDIRLIMNGVDCDDDLILAITSWSSLAYEVATKLGGSDPFSNAPKFKCEGEEFIEASGSHDRLGKASATIPGDTGVMEYAREFALKGSENNTCIPEEVLHFDKNANRSAYTAYFQVSRTKSKGVVGSGSSGSGSVGPPGTNKNKMIHMR